MYKHTQKFFIPSTIANDGLKNILDSAGIPDNYIKYHLDKYFYVIDKLVNEYHQNKEVKKDDFISLNSQILRDVLGIRFYREILNQLIQLGIIESNNHYIKGVKSIGYRLTSDYRNDRTVTIELGKTPFRKKLIELKRKQVSKLKENKVIGKLLDTVTNSISIDYDNSIKYCVSKLLSNYLLYTNTNSTTYLYYNSIPSLSFLCSASTIEQLEYQILTSPIYQLEQFINPKGINSYTLEKFRYDLLSIHKIVEKDFFFSHSETTDRVYHNLSSLSRELKQFIKVDGKDITGIDLSNSQPLFLALILIDYYKKRKLTISPDLQHYIDLCLTGKFYNHLIDLFGKNGYKVKDKDKFKETFYEKIFFCKIPKDERGMQKVFKQYFPTVYAAIIDFKKTDYRQLAIMLQKKESKHFIDDIIGAIYKQHKNVSIFNIHDSIYFTDELVEVIYPIINEVFQKAYGVSPHCKMEKWVNGKKIVTPMYAGNVVDELVTDNTPVKALESLPVIEPIQTPVNNTIVQPKAIVSQIKPIDRPPLKKVIPNSFDFALFMEQNKNYSMPKLKFA